ncbi:MAG: hypothetical protein JXB03_07420 [Spirochaetales bacterium]|nr:hypothetical protein [Spirochaetales bacterium]
MKIAEVVSILDARVIYGHDKLEREVFCACGADLMSDVMAFVKDDVVLLTGLNNIQVIRTADIMDISVIVFVRGKMPSGEMIALAAQKDMILLSTANSLFISSGKLYKAGLTGAGVRPIEAFDQEKTGKNEAGLSE